MAESRKNLYRRALGHEDKGWVLLASGGLIAPFQAVYQAVDVTGMGDPMRSQVIMIAKALDLPPELLLGTSPENGT